MDSKIELKEEQLVLIEMPKLAVPKQLAEQYLMYANKYCNDITNMQVTDFCDGDLVGKYDNVYVDGKFYPVFLQRTNFEEILNIYRPSVTHFDKYVSLQDADVYDYKAQIKELYEKESEKAEEQ